MPGWFRYLFSRLLLLRQGILRAINPLYQKVRWEPYARMNAGRRGWKICKASLPSGCGRKPELHFFGRQKYGGWRKAANTMPATFPIAIFRAAFVATLGGFARSAAAFLHAGVLLHCFFGAALLSTRVSPLRGERDKEKQTEQQKKEMLHRNVLRYPRGLDAGQRSARNGVAEL